MPDLETWLKAPTLDEIAVRLERLRRENPMNGDASNTMLDQCIATLSVLAAEMGTGEDPHGAAGRERTRLREERNAVYERTIGNPEWQAEQRAHGRYQQELLDDGE